MNSILNLKISNRKKRSGFLKLDLGFGDDFDCNFLTLQGPLLGFSRASEPKMASTHFLTELVVGGELLREPKILVETDIALTPFRYRRLIWLHRAVPFREQ